MTFSGIGKQQYFIIIKQNDHSMSPVRIVTILAGGFTFTYARFCDKLRESCDNFLGEVLRVDFFGGWGRKKNPHPK